MVCLVPAAQTSPPFGTLTVMLGGFTLKVAVIDCAASTVTAQVEERPVHAPDHPAKIKPLAGAAVRITSVSVTYVSKQSEPQLIPLPVTVPPFDGDT